VALVHDHMAGIISVYHGSTDVTSMLPLTIGGVLFAHDIGLLGFGDFRVTDSSSGFVITMLDNHNGWPSATVCLPTSLFGTVGGLMGYFDGNFANDYVPQGSTTAVSNIANLTYIASAFGESWRVTAETSTMYYTADQSYATENDPSFMPLIFDLAPFSPTQQAQSACMGLQDQFLTGCLRDVSVMSDASFAQQANVTGALFGAQEQSYAGQVSDASIANVGWLTLLVVFFVVTYL